MAKKASCKLCGAKFEGDRADELAAVHTVDFHPGTDAAKAAAKGKVQPDAEAEAEAGSNPDKTPA